MTYPVVVFVMAILAVVGMLLFIVPTFAKLFDDLGGTLPAPTRVLIFMSDILKSYAPFIVVVLIALVHHLGQDQAHRTASDGSSTRGSSRCPCSATSSRRSRSPASPGTSAR